MAKIAEQFRVETGHTVAVSYGASTKLATQIRNGAPFSVFLSADQQEIRALIKELLAVSGSEFTYAIGRLVLWSPKEGLVVNEGELLRSGRFNRLAIANPKLAPYGKAAREVMEKLEVWQKLSTRLVTGENVTQTHQFAASGNVDLAFVARSQITKSKGSLWLVPQTLYSSLKQDAVLLKRGETKEKPNETAQLFLKFLKSQKTRDIIKEFGYDIPND
jgi:molybdate transport system substrate-binding protein